MSKIIKNYVCLAGISPEPSIILPFSRIVGKYFAFPLKMTFDFDPLNANQTWIFQEMPHSGL
jgi:hypothetical protein